MEISCITLSHTVVPTLYFHKVTSPNFNIVEYKVCTVILRKLPHLDIIMLHLCNESFQTTISKKKVLFVRNW